MGVWYDQGRGVPGDLAEAVRWFVRGQFCNYLAQASGTLCRASTLCASFAFIEHDLDRYKRGAAAGMAESQRALDDV